MEPRVRDLCRKRIRRTSRGTKGGSSTGRTFAHPLCISRLLMRASRCIGPIALALGLIPACKGSDNPSPSLSASGRGPEDVRPAKYATCAGQGANPEQLAPAFLDQMPWCHSADTAPADKLSGLGRDGTIIEGKGDCQFDDGISCHFHTSMEFVDSTKLRDDEHAVGEMHCIVPSHKTDSPTVYGAHLRCKPGTSPAADTKSCSTQLLGTLARCQSGWKCCDNGTLTKPVSKQQDAEKKLRPDFRICQDSFIEIDCGLLHGMHGHTANVAGLGEEITGKFNPQDSDDNHP